MSPARGDGRTGRQVAALVVAVLAVVVGCTPGTAESSVASTSETGRAASSEPTPVSAAPETAQPRVVPVDIGLQANIDAASAFATSQGLGVSIAVIDRALGEEFANGTAADTPIWGASLVKVFLADNILYRQRAGEFRLTGPERGLLEAMIVLSDDSATDSLYSRFGGDAVVTEVAQRYQLPSVAPTTQAGFWELTTMSARDVARYYDRFLARTPPADRDYLLGLLRRIAPTAADGFDQFFGLPAALPRQTLAIKQGWMCCPRDTSYLHTTGILGADNRYTVAILSTDTNVFSTAFSTDLLGRIAALVFPPGSVTG